jgi:hypothetical protein
MPDVKRTAPAKTHVQAVLFNKSDWDEKKAKTWLKSHDFKSDGMHITDNYIRFRQYNPEESRFDYRAEGQKDGIVFIFGFLKGSKKKE